MSPPRYVLVQSLDVDGGFLAEADTRDVPLIHRYQQQIEDADSGSHQDDHAEHVHHPVLGAQRLSRLPVETVQQLRQARRK